MRSLCAAVAGDRGYARAIATVAKNVPTSSPAHSPDTRWSVNRAR